MNHIDSYDYLGFSHAKYLENDCVQYNLKATEMIFKENQGTHFHDDVEIYYIISGEARLFVNNEPNTLSAGNLVMLMPYHVHSFELISNRLTVYQCSVSLGFLLFSSISRLIEKHVSYSLAYGDIIARLTNKEQETVRSGFREIIEELTDNQLFNTMIGLSIINKIILIFSRNITARLSTHGEIDHRITWRLIQYMHMNYSKDISAQSLANEFSLSPLKVNNYFYLLTGENLSENLHRTRIRYACCMLQFDQLSSSYIGKYVGYKNSSSFFRKFKEIKKMTPDEYRKSHMPDDSIYRTLNASWKIYLYLYENYAEPLDVMSISQALFLTPETIHNELITNFDLSLPDLLTKIRLQYARSFLQVLDAPILKIAYMSGFSSVRTFNRCFKNMMGCTPIEYRRKMAALSPNLPYDFFH